MSQNCLESRRTALDDRHDGSLFWCALSGPRDWTLRDWSRAWPTLTLLAKLVGVSVSSSVRNTNFPHTLKPWNSRASVGWYFYCHLPSILHDYPRFCVDFMLPIFMIVNSKHVIIMRWVAVVQSNLAYPDSKYPEPHHLDVFWLESDAFILFALAYLDICASISESNLRV